MQRVQSALPTVYYRLQPVTTLLSLFHSFTLSLSCSVQLLTALPFFIILYFLYSDVIPAESELTV